MSLQLAAQHLAAQGRGPDKQLVHMSPREVAGLQALAMSHGGSLTINPDTGLPEAGFLDNLLPAVIGAGLMFATGGASAAAMPGLFGLGMPATIGLGLGAFETARTGNLQKGLMAGLGAYGGAGMMGALAGAGAAGAGAVPQAAGAGAGAVPQAAGVTPGMGLADTAVGPQFSPDVLGLDEALTTPSRLYANPFTGQPNLADYAYGPEIQSNLLDQQARNQSLADLSERFSGLRIDPLTESQNARLSSMRALGGPEAINAAYGQYPPPLTVSAPVSDTAVSAAPAVAPVTPPRGFLEGMSEVSAVEGPGVSGAGLPTRSTTLASRFAAMPTKDKFKYGLAALSPALLAQPKRAAAPQLDREQYRYAYTPGKVANPEERYMGALTGERTYFQPQFVRVAAEGGMMQSYSRGGRLAEGIRALGSALRDTFHGPRSQAGQAEAYQYNYDPTAQMYAPAAPQMLAKSGGMMQSYAEGGVTEGGGMGGRLSRLGKQPEEKSQDQDRYKYTYDPVKQQYTKIVPPAVPLAAIEAALPFVDTGGYGGGEMGGGPGLAGLSAAALGESHGDAALGAAQGYAAADAVGMSGFDSAGNFGGGDASGSHGAGIDGSGMYAKGGGVSDLGDYSDGGRLLRGPGDGVSDSIPAMIGRKQPARLADGEFVIPARIVSELGNGSTNAGARKLYAMMDRIQKARGKTVGKGKVAKNSKAEKYLPA